MERVAYSLEMMRVARTMTIAMVSLLVAAVTPAAGQDRDECGDRASLAITVTDDSGLVPIPGATIVLRWTDAVRQPVREEADGSGRLVLCVPRDAGQATLWAEFGDASSEEAVVVLERGAAHEVQLGLLFGEMTTGRVVGQVRDARTHRPVVAVEIAVGSRAAVVQSNRTGRFVLSGLPVGEHELSFRHIGFSPLTHSVTVTRGHTTEVDARLTPDPVELEPIVATATRPRRLEIKGFYERKYWGEQLGGGTFFTPRTSSAETRCESRTWSRTHRGFGSGAARSADTAASSTVRRTREGSRTRAAS
ncbi:carboxypeptidase regulatory-like domain-containing protein [Candidatus Palauibacter sp.]|uniref:carboxypeptidase regulatory-like domain-containing protein n=1 Tax=Candidatus Palauibacter sp. TaxID=3101350 RepID=UPI003B022D92